MSHPLSCATSFTDFSLASRSAFSFVFFCTDVSAVEAGRSGQTERTHVTNRSDPKKRQPASKCTFQELKIVVVISILTEIPGGSNDDEDERPAATKTLVNNVPGCRVNVTQVPEPREENQHEVDEIQNAAHAAAFAS